MKRLVENPSPATLAMRLWREKNRAKFKAYQAYYWERNKRKYAATARARSRQYYAEHKEEIKEREKSRYHRVKILKGYATGERSPNWKGNEVGNVALHNWVARHRGRPSVCEHCGLEDPQHPRRFQWANKSGEYKRDLEDWLRLCGKCHFVYDKQHLRRRDWHGRLI